MRRPDPLILVCCGLLTFLLAACQMTPAPLPRPSSTPTATRPFTVISTDPIRSTDPAAVVDQGSTSFALNVFQRLMTTEPGETALKPDAARDCLFTASTVYTCTLNEREVFHNGHALTSSDVKFSIQRARRLAVAQTSTVLLSSLSRIETPDPLTVRFVLRRVDTQFGFALASPAASIVDEQVYPADQLRSASEPIIGSGPFSVVTFTGKRLVLKRNTAYIGKNSAQVDDLVYVVAPDSAAIEAAIGARSVDVAGRGLSRAALTRYQGQALSNGNQLTDNGYRLQVHSGTRIHQLIWSPATYDRIGLRQRDAVAESLQADRTSDSIVPGGVAGHVSAYAVGGRAKPEISWPKRIRLTLGYDLTMPDGHDLADQVKSRIEATDGFSVEIQPGVSTTDLTVVDRKAWTATGGAWLQPYLTAPPAETSSVIAGLWGRYVSEVADGAADRALGALQRQAAIDVTVLPLTQSDEVLLVRDTAAVPEDSYGPGWQLGFFWMRRG